MRIIKEESIGTRPTWDETFMSLAIQNSSRSSCWFIRAGSTFVQDNQVMSSGYNGASAKYEKNCLEVGCAKENNGLKYEESLNSGQCIGIHSEMNGLGHLSKMNPNKMTLYTTIFPCSTCAKNLEPYPIGRIVFKKKYLDGEFDNNLHRLERLGIQVDQLDLSLRRFWDISVYRKWKKRDIWTDEEIEDARAIIHWWEDLFKKNA
jgi:dCMP deaminase